MEYIVTAAAMKQCDAAASARYGISPLVLMERAALETARIILGRCKRDIRVAIAAGSGNNGGDGIAIARILREAGVQTQICLVGDEAKCTPQTAQQLATVRSLGIPVSSGMDSYDYDVIVDALFGIGLSRDVEGVYREVIDGINQSRAMVVAVDMPSGIHTDSGAVMGCAVRADVTVTYGFRKPGQYRRPGAEYAGEVICVPIGIPVETIRDQSDAMFTYTDGDLRLPARDPAGNKGSFGKVLMITGSRGMGGACLMSATAAFRIGAGMVRVFTAERLRDGLLCALPEAMTDTYADDGRPELTQEELSRLQQGIAWADVVAIGCGLSVSDKAKTILAASLEQCRKPMVIDADALNILSRESQLLAQLEHGRNPKEREVVLTPHLGEFARLLQCQVADVQQDVTGCCGSFVQKYDVTLVCKDAHTIVAKRGNGIYFNTSGNDGMATAGSGDVLTGIIAGLTAQGMESREAAVMGVYAHGLAGDIAKERSSAYYIMAQDIISSLKYL